MSTNSQGATIRRRKVPSLRRRDGLIAHAYDITSQSGEDGIIHRLFDLLPMSPSSSDDLNNNTNCRWCVDVGAWDGKHLSNTFSLLVPSSSQEDINTSTNNRSKSSPQQNWKGILIEADPSKIKDLKQLHQPLGNICIQETVSCRPSSTQSLSHILLTTNIAESESKSHTTLPSDFDFLCIDVDGIDYWIMQDVLTKTKGFTPNEKPIFRPKVICCEFNPTIPHDVIYIPPKNDKIRHGCSLAAIVELASMHNYQLCESTCYNAFFVDQDLYDRYIQNTIPFHPTIETVHEITMGTRLYQLYDGQLKLSGCQKLLWLRHRINEEDIQVLKNENQRNFPFAPQNDHVGSGECGDNFNNGDEERKADLDDHQYFHDIAIDISPYIYQDDTTEQQKHICAQRMIKQLAKDGFVYVRGSGMSRDMCDEAIKWTKNFFHESTQEQVRRSCLSKIDRARRGYSPANTENFASLIAEKGRPNDLVRKFRIGPSSPDNNSENDCLGPTLSSSTPISKSSLCRPNCWPAEEVWGKENSSGFSTATQKYYDKLVPIAQSILESIVDGILLKEEFACTTASIPSDSANGSTRENISNFLKSLLTSSSAQHSSILTLLNYRKGARHQGKHARPLVAAHTDVALLTVLLFDAGDSAMLQRVDHDHGTHSTTSNSKTDWVDVTLPKTIPDDPIFVVNIGDCLSDLCAGMLPSTLHRVMPQKNGTIPRNCAALFVGLAPDQELILPNNDVVSFEEWRKRRIARAASVLKS